MKPKKPTLGSSCKYKFMNSGTIGYGCNYDGYCDYQLPRDSRGRGGYKDSVKDSLNYALNVRRPAKLSAQNKWTYLS